MFLVISDFFSIFFCFLIPFVVSEFLCFLIPFFVFIFVVSEFVSIFLCFLIPFMVSEFLCFLIPFFVFHLSLFAPALLMVGQILLTLGKPMQSNYVF